ncbi:phosphotransferase [Terrihabitans soli]|nr:phosphotransferase [Terrihabitans soli]
MAVLEALRESVDKASDSAFGENKRAVLFGTVDSQDAAGQIDRFVARTLATRITEVLFLKMASACAAGLKLSDGRSVFLKIHAGELDLDQLHAVHDAQGFLRERGIPAARLVLPATEFGNGKFATVHAFRSRGDRARAYHRGTIEGAAAMLARIVEGGRAFPLRSSIPDMFAAGTSPLKARAPGIAEPPPLPPAERASAVLEKVKLHGQAISGDRVIAHDDYASRNLRFSDGEVSSVFDFEALRGGVEPVLVGRASIQFINEPSGVRDPAAAAVKFVRAYENSARRMFEGEAAAALDAGVALSVAQFCRSLVRSDGARDEDAPKIFANFMERFRATLGREYPKNPFI